MMTPEEQFDRVFASAMQDRQALLHFLDGVTAIQARWHPPDGEWSILEGLEHIMLTEEFFRSGSCWIPGSYIPCIGLKRLV
jgi:hypothetical protein